MTTWYVRPDTSHSGTRNGTSYDTAWGGWAAIVWGGAGVTAGDTLYVCGAHTASAQINIGAHGATSSSRTTISGGYEPDPGSFTFAAGSVFLFINRNYTTIADLTLSAGTLYAIYMYAANLTGITIQRCTLNGGVGQSIINLSGADTLSYIDLNIDDNDFVGGSGGAFGSAITWVAIDAGTPETSPATFLTRVNITNNRFTGCSSTRAVIDLWAQHGTNVASKITDIVISDNTFTDCYAVALEIIGPESYGWHSGIRITGNTFRNQQGMGILGGAMSISSFGPSLTDSFGSNIIARNEAYGLHGPSGMVNVFFGSYRIYHNIGEDLTTGTIDGTGILFDHGCDRCVAFGNTFRRLIGLPGVYYSGNGITVLDATNIRVFGNIIEDAYCGIHLGDKKTGQSTDIHNNTFLRCSMAVDLRNVADMTNNLVRNNIFTATVGVPSVRVEGGTWTGESGNCFYGFGSAINHTLHASDETIDPELDSDYRPGAAALKGAGTYLGGKDYAGKVFYNPPNIGAVDALPMAPRYALRQR